MYNLTRSRPVKNVNRVAVKREFEILAEPKNRRILRRVWRIASRLN